MQCSNEKQLLRILLLNIFTVYEYLEWSNMKQMIFILCIIVTLENEFLLFSQTFYIKKKNQNFTLA